WLVGARRGTCGSPQIAAWRETAERLLPDQPLQAMAETLVLSSGDRTGRSARVDGGSYTLSMVCSGIGGQVRVQLSSTGADSGRAVPCREQEPGVNQGRVPLADEFYMRLSAENDAGGAVFRWRLDRARGF